ncbi:glycosyltransferase family 2 protein [Aspergillus homomorphus CBS 101889]|uniref:Glycosyltransferase 2-like domain-containing protein n=1 Tax=Aspergillus homomorphus (strain CBS 101889) TaxID=1450537 RepID=A0A395HV57_ASPHC|nr:hypothetical protein BO97DRAFT_453431 [Aspergillus homomorphus CBS 101889]RAL11822.1 hypothetical protein BO97DRAFT_453431 [Aspergillus homomorphus CBS 101889]
MRPQDDLDLERKPLLDRRSRKLFQILNYNWAIFPLTALLSFLSTTSQFPLNYPTKSTAAVYSLMVWAGVPDAIVKPGVLWTRDCTIITLIIGPFLLAQFPPYYILWGMCLPVQPFSYANAPKQRSFRSFRVCLVTKATNIQGIELWKPLSQAFRITFVVVVDSAHNPFRDLLPSWVEQLQVPPSFQAERATHKARVLEWYRRHSNLTERDWVLHLDEETEIDDYLMQACLDFIERGSDDIGMGTIYYNASSHWKNPFTTVAEILRIAENFGRYQLPVRFFGQPLLGFMRGSFLLLNGQVENAVTWDTDCMTEDHWFAFYAAKQGFKFGWLNAIAREQAPATIADLLRQRRRWYSGELMIPSWPLRVMVAFNIWADVDAAYRMMTMIYGGWMISVSYGFFAWTTFNLAVLLHGRVVACLMEDLDCHTTALLDVPVHVVLTVLLAPVVDLVQAATFLWTVVWPTREFTVIRKQ